MTDTAHHTFCFNHAYVAAVENGAEDGSDEAYEWAASYLTEGLIECTCEDYR